MLKKVIGSFVLAINNIRSHFFHTLLSVLGIVIGVGALVSILSLIDGMERYAKEQIAATTSLNGVIIYADQYKVVNNVRLRKDTIRYIDFDDFQEMQASLTKPATTFIRSSSSEEIAVNVDRRIGASVMFTDSTLQPGVKVVQGRKFSASELNETRQVAVVNQALLKLLHPTIDTTNAIGSKLTVRGKEVEIIGVANERTDVPQCFLPITLLNNADYQSNPTTVLLEAGVVTDVPKLKEDVRHWLKNRYLTFHSEFQIVTNEFRVEQAAQGFLLFRVIMGLIVGISVLVGGIGVMNVLLISVTERTSEIGIRKAVGATRRDIVLQFLSESVTISTFGSFLGLVLGVLGTMIIIPIIKALTKIPFQADYTTNTLAVISIVALAVGILFGTYPALRASRLDPVEAIRRNE